MRGQPRRIRSTLDARYRYILVDEYQDTNLAQYSIVRALSIDHPNLAVTGDPDQSIYGWRGANLKNILDFEHDFPEVRVVKLERNYRSTKAILRAADALIGHNRRRKQKALYTENDEGRPVSLISYTTGQDEAELIAGRIADDIRAGKRRPRDFAIFYRVNALSRSLEFALRHHGIPYQMVNGLEFYQRKEIKDVLAYLRLVNNPRDDNALLRIINTPPRGIGKTTIDRLLAHAAQRRLPLLEGARESGLIAGVAKRAAVAVARFVAMIDRMALLAAAPVEEVLGHILSESGYRALLEQSEDEEDQERLANLEELLTAARQFDEQHAGENSLESFLEEASLVADVDAWDADTDRATLMTLHASKGLEFPVVFIIALEEGLIPHERSRSDDDSVEEERRLLFVGMTRAKDELQLSLGQYREFRGQRRMTIPSPFLLELPRHELRMIGFGPSTAGEYRMRRLPDDVDHGDAGEGVEPEHLDAEALDFDVHDIHADAPPTGQSWPARAGDHAGHRGRIGRRGAAGQRGGLARRICPRPGRASSAIWAGEDHRAERCRAAARGHGGVRLDGGAEEVRPVAKPAAACEIAPELLVAEPASGGRGRLRQTPDGHDANVVALRLTVREFFDVIEQILAERDGVGRSGAEPLAEPGRAVNDVACERASLMPSV